VRFPLRHDVDPASVTYLHDIDLIARAVDAQLARYRGRTSGATDRVGPPSLSERLRRRGRPSSLDVVHKANCRA